MGAEVNARTEERRLIAYIGDGGRPAEKRKRGTVVDGLLGWTDDGYVVHIPTGRGISPPQLPDGSHREDCLDDRKFVYWLLDQDPEGWESTRSYSLGEKLTTPLARRLKAVRDRYPGD